MKQIIEHELTEVLQTLREYLERLETLSDIQELVGSFDAPALMERAEEMANCQDAIHALLKRMDSLFDEIGISSLDELEACALHDPSSALLDICRRIRSSCKHIQQQQSLSAMQLSAAQQVAQSILAQAGLVEINPTYGPGRK